MTFIRKKIKVTFFKTPPKKHVRNVRKVKNLPTLSDNFLTIGARKL